MCMAGYCSRNRSPSIDMEIADRTIEAAVGVLNQRFGHRRILATRRRARFQNASQRAAAVPAKPREMRAARPAAAAELRRSRHAVAWTFSNRQRGHDRNRNQRYNRTEMTDIRIWHQCVKMIIPRHVSSIITKPQSSMAQCRRGRLTWTCRASRINSIASHALHHCVDYFGIACHWLRTE